MSEDTLVWDNGSTTSGLAAACSVNSSTTMSNINRFDKVSITLHHTAGKTGFISLVNSGWTFVGDNYNVFPSPGILIGIDDYLMRLTLIEFYDVKVYTGSGHVVYSKTLSGDFDYTAEIDFLGNTVKLIKDNIILGTASISACINPNLPMHLVYCRCSDKYGRTSDSAISTSDIIAISTYRLYTDSDSNSDSNNNLWVDKNKDYYGILKE